jgi:hypothetical protein
MGETVKTIRDVRVYTASLCCWGELALPPEARAVEFLNDAARRFFLLQQAQVTGGDVPGLGAQKTAGDILINRANVIVVVIPAGTVPLPTKAPDEIVQASERIVLYAPPYEIEGDVQRHPLAQLADVLSAASGDLLAVENDAIRAGGAAFKRSNLHWAVVNRHAIHALRSLGEGGTRPSLWTIPKRQFESAATPPAALRGGS